MADRIVVSTSRIDCGIHNPEKAITMKTFSDGSVLTENGMGEVALSFPKTIGGQKYFHENGKAFPEFISTCVIEKRTAKPH
ncbi:MAG: hypothetical protein IPK79_05865 [Vampirovibrionales bacterium]|nr:hypothetical protein [Vampirovibrionales bacterium]